MIDMRIPFKNMADYSEQHLPALNPVADVAQAKSGALTPAAP
jgi:hypothetical protein